MAQRIPQAAASQTWAGSGVPKYGVLQPPRAQVAASKAPSFKDVGWLLAQPSETPGSVLMALDSMQGGVQQSGMRAYKVAPQRGPQFSYSDPSEVLGVALFRRQAIVGKIPAQFGTDSFSLGHYAPFRNPRPVGTAPGTPPLLAEMQNSAFQPISRGGHMLVSITEMNYEGGPAATNRRFANTRFGLWFKTWVVGGANIRPLGSVQTPSPQFRGVFPNYGYMTLPQVIGS